jgi:TIR domain
MGNSFSISGSSINNLTGEGNIINNYQQPPHPEQPQLVNAATVAQTPSESAQPLPTTKVKTKHIEVFFSYSHRDEELRDELAKHLSILKRQGVISAWYDRDIAAGTEWATAIDHHLNSAQVILLLISPDFMASDYCFDIEMQRAIERHEAGEAIVIPIILRPVDWSGAPFGKLQACPKNAQPVTSWANRDEAFLNVAQSIRKAVEQLI